MSLDKSPVLAAFILQRSWLFFLNLNPGESHMMQVFQKRALPLLLATLALASSHSVWAHGDVVPQAVDTTGLEPLGEEWREVNPYVGNERAIQIGASAYNSNCARCHGLEAVSGGIAPDLRELPNGQEGDEFYLMRVRDGAVRNGVTYMPKFEGIVSQEGLWAVRAWLESISVETAEAGPAPAAVATATAEEKPAEPAAATAATEEKPAEPAATPETPEKKTELNTEAKPEPTSSHTATDPDSQLAKVKAKGILEVAVYKEFPPYSYLEKGVAKGIDVDLAKELAKRVGVSASIRLVTPDENVEDDLRNNVWKGHYLGGGVADVMLHAPVDRDFAKMVDQVSFISPYQLERLVFAFDTRKVGQQPTIANFTSQPIGVELDTLSDFYLLRAVEGKISPNIHHYKNLTEAVAALKAGEIAAIMGPQGEVEGLLTEKPDSIVVQRLVTPGLSRDTWALGLAVKASHEDLTATLNTAMAAMVQEGVVEKVFKDYGVTYQPPAIAPQAKVN